MNSPFSDYIGRSNPFDDRRLRIGEVNTSTALSDPALLSESSHEVDLEQEDDQFENQVPDPTGPVKIGSATLTRASDTVAFGSDYREPLFSGNPLLNIPDGTRAAKLSANFSVGEFARAGNTTFKYARIDPSLIDNIQRLREFVGKPMEIIDGYYSPKYLKDVLKVTDLAKQMLNPHVTGRAAKLNFNTFKGVMKQVAIASFVVCDKDIYVGIGSSSIVLAVKQPSTNKYNVPEYDPLVQSYIDNEKEKVEVVNFCADVKRLMRLDDDNYERDMRKATGNMAAAVLRNSYRIAYQPEDYRVPLRSAIARLHKYSATKNPNVLLYVLAYSDFGNLYRTYYKTAPDLSTAYSVIAAATGPNEPPASNPYSLLWQRSNKPIEFIKTCSARITSPGDSWTSHVVKPNFFDWRATKQDNEFLTSLGALIAEVYKANNFDLPKTPAPLPAGGTVRDMTIAKPSPYKVAFDYSGRYSFKPTSGEKDTVHGGYILINQAGKYLSGKFGLLYKNGGPEHLRSIVHDFFGVVDEVNGIARCSIYPSKTIMLERANGKVKATLRDAKKNIELAWYILTKTSNRPFLSNLMVESLVTTSRMNEDLIVTLAWIRPPAAMMMEYIKWVASTHITIKAAIKHYYDEDETVPNVKKNLLKKYVWEIGGPLIKNPLPYMLRAFANYYLKYLLSVSEHWTLRSDRETRSTLDWGKRMLEDYRDFMGTSNIQSLDHVYALFGVSMEMPGIQYQYHVDIKVNAIGVGPFSRSSGTIVVKNTTDYSKYPTARRWDQDQLDITLYSASVSLSPFKLLPKLSAGESFDADARTPIFYDKSDFSGADVWITEGKLFEVPIPLPGGGGLTFGTKISKGAYVILIEAQGKKEIEFNGEQNIDWPSTLEIEPDIKGEKLEEDGLYEKISKMLPSLGMYKGSIDRKDTKADIPSVPLPNKFESNYSILSRNYFRHDNAQLLPDAIAAIGKMCAEELVAFSDPDTTVTVYGHTDASGTASYNIPLSMARALNTIQAIKDRLGNKLKTTKLVPIPLGESEANLKYGEKTQKNAWLRKVVIIVNGRAVLSLGEA